MILSELYLFIMKRLIGTTGKLNDEIKHFDWFNHQYEAARESNENPFMRPAVFFEMDPITPQTLGMRRQAADVIFRLHVVSDIMQEMNSNEDEQFRNLALEHMDLCDLIFYWLQNYTNGTTIGSINRTGITPDHNHDDLIIHILEFRTRMVDDAAVHTLVPVTPDIKIIPDIIPNR